MCVRSHIPFTLLLFDFINMKIITAIAIPMDSSCLMVPPLRQKKMKIVIVGNPRYKGLQKMYLSKI